MEITSCHWRGADVYLDGVITVVDSKHCLMQMKETRDNGAINEWLRQVGTYTFYFFPPLPYQYLAEYSTMIIIQVGVADMLIINKTDLVDEETKNKVIETVKGINSASKLLTTVRSVVDVNDLLDLHAYDSLRQLFHK